MTLPTHLGSGTPMGATTRKLRLRVNGNTPKPFSIGNKIGEGLVHRVIYLCAMLPANDVCRSMG